MKKKNYLLEKITEIFSKEKGGKVLDLGCRDGDYSKMLKDLGFEIIACDLERSKKGKRIFLGDYCKEDLRGI